MPHKAALLLSAALSVFVLLGLAGVAVVAIADNDIWADAADDGEARGQQDIAAAIDAHDREFVEQFQAANAALLESYRRYEALQAETEALREQNAALLEREARYRALIDRANELLAAGGEPAVPDDERVAPDAPGQTAPVSSAVLSTATSAATSAVARGPRE